MSERRPAASSPDGVVLLHGIGRTARSFRRMELIIAGNRSIYPITSMGLPRPHDGRVSVANSRLDGMADHIVIRTSHPWLVRNREAIAQTIAFLREGRFRAQR